MRKPLILLGVGILGLSGLLFYAEHNQRRAQESDAVVAVEEVLKAQNLALAGRLFDGINRAERDALLTSQRWKKKAKIRSFLADTSFSEPEAPKWMIVGERRVRAAGMADDPLLEDALEKHLASAEKLFLHTANGKYFLFIRGEVDGQPFASAYAPEAFFSAFRSADGIRVWLALQDGTVVYHPLQRFIGSNAANLKPIAAGIRELSAGGALPFASSYLGLEGNEALGAWTPLPSHGLLVGSEWPKAPQASFRSSAFFWFAISSGLLGALVFGFAFAGPRRESEPRMFEEGRLDEDAMEYLETARASTEKAYALAREKEALAAAALVERDRVLTGQANLAWKARVLEEYQEKVLPQFTGKQVWGEICDLITARTSGLSALFYRYSPSSFSLVPETMHGVVGQPDSAVAFLHDTRIYVGNTSYLEVLLETEAFQRWNSRREKQMPGHQTEFRAYTIQCAGMRGLILVYFDRRSNSHGELAEALELLESLVRRTATFCDSLGRLLQSMNAKGSAWKAVASSTNHPGSRPQPS